MNVLLLRLCGPMQSWGVQSRFSVRDTGLEPSKSGVTGMLAAALGRPRHADIADLAQLRMAVRADVEGILRYDYHTAQDVLKASGGLKDTEPSRRYYLADACFLVALAGDNLNLMQHLLQALLDPVWPLFLGRKAFVPSVPPAITQGLLQQADPLSVLQKACWLGSVPDKMPAQLRITLEDPLGTEVRQDQPISFSLRHFAPRRVRTLFISTDGMKPFSDKEVLCTSPA
ncbi:MAG: type I-E CRISPR-associated protein Cas5/CasD [Anaerolineae bacterium]